jgi:hypothetical protein
MEPDITIEQLDDGSVVKTETVATVIETYQPEQLEEINTQIARINAAIADLPNFTARRKANLEAELAERQQIKTLLTQAVEVEPQPIEQPTK